MKVVKNKGIRDRVRRLMPSEGTAETGEALSEE